MARSESKRTASDWWADVLFMLLAALIVALAWRLI